MNRFSKVITAVGITLMALSIAAYGQVKDTSKAAKPKSITLMVDGTFLIKDAGESILVDGYKQLTGVDLVLNHPIHNEYAVKVNLAFSTGDIPDVVLLNNNSYLNFALNGALYDMTKLYDNSRLKKTIKNPGVIDALKLDGKLYGIPTDRGNGTITYVRGDWLEKLGLAVPTNYAEFLNMLRLFKNKNPDGLSPDKVIAITSAGLVNTEFPLDIYLREFYQDATPDFVKRGGKWVDGMSEPAMVKALARMREAYGEGLIDKEIITNKTSTARDKFYSGNVGVFNYWAGTWGETMAVNIRPNAPQAKVTPIPAIKETKYVERPATAVAITSSCKNPEGVFEYFFERLWDGAEGQKFITFGVEGKTYTVVDGLIKFMPSLQDPKKPFTKAWFSPEIPVTNWKPTWKPAERISKSLEMFQKDSVAYSLFPASETLNKLIPELNAMKTNIVSKIVYGDMTIEAGLAAYAKDSAAYTKAILKDLNK